MPVHDWSRVDAGIYHHFHNTWTNELSLTLNNGLLPPDFYALTEQHAGKFVVDLLTLHARPPVEEPPCPAAGGGLAVAEAPPKVRRTMPLSASNRLLQRTVTVRHVSGHRLIPMVEIVSPANKDRAAHVTELAEKIATALARGVHVLLVDLIQPGKHDPAGIHGAVCELFDTEPYDLPPNEPLTLAAYVGDSNPQAYIEHMAVGGALPEMPLFLHAERYVNLPLEQTYQTAFRGMPAFWRDVLEGRKQPE
jgi:hypothetical protein